MDVDVSITEKKTKMQSAEINAPQFILDFISVAKKSAEHLVQREQALDARLKTTEQLIESELKQVQVTISNFQDILKSTNAKEWQEKTEAVHKEGKQQLTLLQNFLSETLQATRDACVQLDKTSTQIVKGLSKTLSTLHTNDLEQLADDTNQHVKTVAEDAVKRIGDIIHWFNWKNLALTAILAFIITLFIGLYIDDEWPWEEHKNVVKERVAGHAVLQAWTQLNYVDQLHILTDMA